MAAIFSFLKLRENRRHSKAAECDKEPSFLHIFIRKWDIANQRKFKMADLVLFITTNFI